MASILKRGLQLLRTRETPRIFASSGWQILNSVPKIEEERVVAFSKGLFYPVTLGQVFKDRYQVLTKLGFGANSTVWLCRDLQDHRYAALKVYINHSSANREVNILTHLSSLVSDHPGQHLVRQLQDSFFIEGPTGSHACIVHEPLLINLFEFQYMFCGSTMTEGMLKGVLREILTALDYLHSVADVIHTDLQAKNIIIATTDSTIFQEWDNVELHKPSPRKVVQDYTVYQSRRFDMTNRKGWRGYGNPILCDFGEARLGEKHHGSIQPNLFRAPEVILGMEWTKKVDIWNLGTMIWGLFEDGHLFASRIAGEQETDETLLGHMTTVLGPPPADFIALSDNSEKYWTKEGIWVGGFKLPKESMNSLEEYLEGDDRDQFLNLIRRMVTWRPEDRSTAAELLKDEWLNK